MLKYLPQMNIEKNLYEGTMCKSWTVTATVMWSNPHLCHWETGKAGRVMKQSQDISLGG